MALQSHNNMVILGHLKADPVIRYSNSGEMFAWFQVEMMKAWKDSNGIWQEITEWHHVAATGELAEMVRAELRKGCVVYLDCNIHTRNWQDRKGVKRYATELIAQSIRLPDKRMNSAVQRVN